MSDLKYSVFYYGHTITSENFSLDFDEGSGEIQASLSIGDYGLTELLVEVKTQMDAVGGQPYTVAVDRDTRIVTISASSNFDLLVDSGSRVGTSVFGLLGFTTDQTGANTYKAALPSGSAYFLQYPLQNYVSFDDWKESIDPSVSKSSAGNVQTVSFGVSQFMEGDFKFINDYNQPKVSPLESNPTGVQDVRTFLDFAIQKRKLEFLYDRSQVGVFTTCILESSPESSSGTAYKLKENRKAAGFFDTGALTFRKV